jgi:uncharacterized protein (DUF58 family)
MNEALIPSVKPSPAPDAPGVYADLASLIRLRFKGSGISLLPRQSVTSVLAGRHASRLRGRGLNFEEIRRYFPGDDIRQIDWKVTARTRIPHARVYTEERGRDTLLVVDQRLGMFFGSRKNFKSVTAAEAAAVAGWRVVAVKDRVSAIVFGDNGLDVVPGGGKPDDVMRILQAIVSRNRSLGIDRGIVPAPEMLDIALEKAERLVRHDALVLVITDASGSGPATSAILSRIAAHNDVALAFIHDPLESELPDAGRKVFGHAGLQLEADTSAKSLRRDFSDTFRKRYDEARKFLIQREIPLMPIRTDDDISTQLRRLLGKAIRK